MTIASFHQQVEIGKSIPTLLSLNVLRCPAVVREQLDSPSDEAQRYWFIWP